MNKICKLVSIIVTVCFIATLIPVNAFAKDNNEETTRQFDDVETTDWFYEPVQYVNDKGLMTGTETNQFSPQLATTRGMIVSILHRMEGAVRQRLRHHSLM